ncbi:MAG: hypothetical protein K0S56_1714 [Microvirga sp.]|jgi:hypothetical protein|nr:hypothetical protein [Microvirga sp.]
MGTACARHFPSSLWGGARGGGGAAGWELEGKNSLVAPVSFQTENEGFDFSTPTPGLSPQVGEEKRSAHA